MKKTILILGFFLAFIFVLAMMPAKVKTPGIYYSKKDIDNFHSGTYTLPFTPPVIASIIDSANIFLHPVNCQGCHGYDALHLANVDLQGNDVNLFDDWETSMMALSAIDPFWRAKVSQETILDPVHSTETQTLCTSCHAPLGHFTAMFQGALHYTIAQLDTDSLGKSGVACGGCHSIMSDSLAPVLFSGNLHYDTSHKEYGPFPLPDQGPMQLYIGMTPEFSTHMSRSTVCASCHTLISNVTDLAGNYTGNTFVEQATFHEWENSSFPAQDIVCQTCHMPAIDDPIQIANGNINEPPRSPFNLHQFAGANSFMVNLIKNNKDSLGNYAPDANYDSTLSAINIQLTKNSLTVKIDTEYVHPDTLAFSVTLTNKAGHKFPSGYPSRRAVLQFVVTKDNISDTLFASGMFDSHHEVINVSSPFEIHHNIISSSGQSQIYEMVMGDVNGNKTTILERSNSKLKDNRIPPAGFTTTHSVYDTCFIAGDAATDADFNKNGSVEGTGKDKVHYHVALNGYKGKVHVSASVYYQTIPPAWLNEMRTLSSLPINRFLNMFDAEDNSPLLVAGDTSSAVIIDGISDALFSERISVSPNPTRDGRVQILGDAITEATEISVYNSRMEMCRFNVLSKQNGKAAIELPASPGMYFILVKTSAGSALLKVLKI